MKLNKNALPVKIDFENALAIVQKEFNRKGHKVTLTNNNFHLNITPFWVCFYDVDSNKNGNYKHFTGQTALNALTNKSQDEYLAILDHYSSQIIDSVEVSLEKIEIRVKKKLVTKEEAQEIITKMLSCKFEVLKENVTLSGFEEVYIPIWKCKYKDYDVLLDGVIGKINNFNEITKKEKTNQELFTEVVSDLKKPKMFFKYLSNLFKDIFKIIIKNWVLFLVFLIVCVIAFFILF